MPKTKNTIIDNNNDICAAGIIFYNGNKILLSHRQHKKFGCIYEDLGGSVEKQDEYVYKTASREAFEELNMIIPYETIESSVKEANYIYSAKSKYALYYIKAPIDIYNTDVREYGIQEINNSKILRNVEWIDKHELGVLNLHPRLKNVKHKLIYFS